MFFILRQSIGSQKWLSDTEIMKLSAIPKYRHLLCIKGEGKLVAEKISYPIQKADSYLLPPSQDYTIHGNLTFLLTDPPEMSY